MAFLRLSGEPSSHASRSLSVTGTGSRLSRMDACCDPSVFVIRMLTDSFHPESTGARHGPSQLWRDARTAGPATAYGHRTMWKPGFRQPAG